METKLNYKRTFLIGLAFLSICSFWQMYDNIIPLILQNTYHLGETMTGAVMALDNVLAIFLLPVFGALSDKVHTKLGRRMPFIVAGTYLDHDQRIDTAHSSHEVDHRIGTAAQMVRSYIRHQCYRRGTIQSHGHQGEKQHSQEDHLVTEGLSCAPSCLFCIVDHRQ